MAKQHLDDVNVQELAREGYNKQAAVYLEWANKHKHPRLSMLKKLFTHLHENGSISNLSVLELGCGAGDPITLALASNAEVTHIVANDISRTQLDMAHERLSAIGPDAVAKAKLVESDMLALDFPDGHFDAVLAYYSIIHLRREDQKRLMRKIEQWLKTGTGMLLCCFGAQESEGDLSEDWLGMKAYWSSWGVEGSIKMVEEAGLEVVEKLEMKDESDANFLWLWARKR